MSLSLAILLSCCDLWKFNFCNNHLPIFWSVITFLVIVAVVICLMSRKSRSLLGKLSNRTVLISATFIVWAIGVYLYSLGFNHEGSEGNYLATVPRAILSALQMFLSQSDLNDIAPAFKRNECFMVVFSLTHLFAMLITAMFIFRLVGFRLSNWLRVIVSAYPKGKRKCYVFWGINSQSYVLAKDICSQCEKEKPIIVFVKTLGDSENSENQSVGIERLFNLVALHNREVDYIERINALYANCKFDLGEVDLPNNSNVFELLQLSNLGRMISRCSETHIFFLSEIENNNLRSALNLMKDSKYLPKVKKLKIYCHARKTARNEVFGNYNYYNGDSSKVKAELNLIDSSYLSVMEIKQELNYQPVSYLEIDEETATVKNKDGNEFNAMIIGYGETGQEALKFYWEYSALPMYVGPDVKKSRFHCNVIDSDMNNLKAQVVANIPILANTKDVEFISASINSEEYWNTIKREAPRVNAVVVSLGNDDLSMDTAVNVFKYLLKVRWNGNRRFTVFVRNYKLENLDKMKCIADTYSSAGCGSFGAEMVVFGGINDVYTYDQIVSERLLLDAKKFHKIYQLSVANASTWDQEFGPNAVNEKAIRYRSKYLAVREIVGKIQQNISNAMHVETKLYLTGVYKWKYMMQFHNKSINREENTIKYAEMDDNDVAHADQTRLENLAVAEHLRWVAAYEMMGYVYGPEKDYSQKTHPYMKDYKLLDETTKSYDCNVVDTSFRIVIPQKDEPNQLKTQEQSV